MRVRLLFLMVLTVSYPVFGFAGIDGLTQRWNQEVEMDSELIRDSNTQADRVLPVFAISRAQKQLIDELRTPTVTGFELQGSVVIDQTVVDTLLADYLGKTLSNTELNDVAAHINTYYKQQGYISAQVSLADPAITNGIVRMVAQESHISRLQIAGNRRLSKEVVAEHFRSVSTEPMNAKTLSHSLQQLRSHPMIDSVQAYLYPLHQDAQYALLLRVNENKPYEYAISVNNYQSPLIGAEGVHVSTRYNNYFGWSERAQLSLYKSWYHTQLGFSYDMPLRQSHIMLLAGGSYSSGQINNKELPESGNSNESFDTELRNENRVIHLELGYRSSRWQGSQLFRAGLQWQKMQTKIADTSDLFDEPDVYALRFGWRGDTVVRSFMLEFDTAYRWNLFGAAQPSGYRGQLQYHVQLSSPVGIIDTDSLLFKIAGQFAPGALASIDRYPLGGRYSLRGIRENALLADNVLSMSLDYHLPLLIDAWLIGEQRVMLIPFVDYGQANVMAQRTLNTLISTGLGLRWQSRESYAAELFWAWAPGKKDDYSGRNLQDFGVSFNFSYRYF
ncbi:MAG: hypothetical protein OEZ43_15200 [Gammaproteobacteria bacterium]|nr:hypothetical protein [Gammaproteobacteria bacterium]